MDSEQSLKLASKFFLAVVLLGILGFALIIVLGNLFSSANSALPSQDGGLTSNETTTVINATGAFLSVSTVNGVACTITRINNASGEINYNLDNFTITNCLVANTTTTDAGIQGKVVNVTYTHTFKDDAAVNSLSNLTAGTESFFSNAGSWFTLLSVVIIIAIITLVINIVRSTRKGDQSL